MNEISKRQLLTLEIDSKKSSHNLWVIAYKLINRIFDQNRCKACTCPAGNGCRQRDSQCLSIVLSLYSQWFEQVAVDVEYTHFPHPWGHEPCWEPWWTSLGCQTNRLYAYQTQLASGVSSLAGRTNKDTISLSLSYNVCWILSNERKFVHTPALCLLVFAASRLMSCSTDWGLSLSNRRAYSITNRTLSISADFSLFNTFDTACHNELVNVIEQNTNCSQYQTAEVART